jgi:hypothetical protein
MPEPMIRTDSVTSATIRNLIFLEEEYRELNNAKKELEKTLEELDQEKGNIV